MKNKSSASALITLMLMVVPGASTAQRQWTFEDCLQYAVEHNIDIQQRAIDIRMQKNELNSADNEVLPEVTLRAGQQFSFGNALAATGTMPASTDNFDADLSYTTASIGLEMPVFNGFRTKNHKLAAHYSLEQATANMAFARKSLKIQIATYYLQTLYEQSMVRVGQEQVTTSRKLCERARALVDDGRKPMSDLAQAEAQLADDEYNLTVYKGRERMALLTLAQLLNLENTHDFAIADMDATDISTADIVAPETIYNEVSESYPSIKAAKAAIEQKKADVAIARADYWPQLSLRASLNDYYLNFFHQSPANSFGDAIWKNRNEVIGLHLTMPLFDRFKTRNNIRNAKLSLSYSQLALNDKQQQLRKEIEQAYTNILTAQDRYHSAQKALEANTLSCSYETDKYEAGRSNIYDLIQAQNRLHHASETIVEAKYEYIIRQKILDIYKTTE